MYKIKIIVWINILIYSIISEAYIMFRVFHFLIINRHEIIVRYYNTILYYYYYFLIWNIL